MFCNRDDHIITRIKSFFNKYLHSIMNLKSKGKVCKLLRAAMMRLHKQELCVFQLAANRNILTFLWDHK